MIADRPGAAVQVLSAKAQVLLLESVITTNGLKSIPAQTHVQPGIQQDHVYDAGVQLLIWDPAPAQCRHIDS